MKLKHILLLAGIIPLSVLAQPGRSGVLPRQAQPQMQLQRQPQMQPQVTSIDAELQKLLVAEGAISALYV